ncbi:MAG: hypothetical protein WDZ29_00795 [Balneolaceae bacterium]
MSTFLKTISPVTIFALFLFAGCGSTEPNFADRGTVQIAENPESNQVSFLGITHMIPDVNPDQSPWNASYFLRTFMDTENGELVHQLYTDVLYTAGDRREYNSANMQGGINLQMSRIRIENLECPGYSRCAFREIVGIIIPDQALRNNSDGLRVNLHSSSGQSLELHVRQAQISAQLQALDSYRGM